MSGGAGPAASGPLLRRRPRRIGPHLGHCLANHVSPKGHRLTYHSNSVDATTSLRRLPASPLPLVAGAVVKAVVDELGERSLVLRVDEVRVTRELAAGGEYDAVSAGDRVANHEPHQGQLHRVRAGADVAAAVRHVTLVIGAVEPLAVPAVREVDVQLQERPARWRS